MNVAKLTLTATVLAAALGLALGLGAVPAQAAPPECKGPNKNDPECQDPGSDPEGGASFVRAFFDSAPGQRVRSDDVEICGGYDYWDGGDTDLIANENCTTYNISSNASGGGRWFLLSIGGAGLTGDAFVDEAERWLEVDFSVSPIGSACPDLDVALYGTDGMGGPFPGTPGPTEVNTDECIDNLAIRLRNDRILKKQSTRQQPNFEIAWRTDSDGDGTLDDWWTPTARIDYFNPLYLIDGDGGNGCPVGSRIMTTDATGGSPDVSDAELFRLTGNNSEVSLGTFSLPLWVCVIRNP